MKYTEALIIAIAVTSIIGFLIWRSRNIKGSRRRGSAKHIGTYASSRAADLQILTPMEERIRSQAERLIKKGRVIQASQMLEQVGLHRLAISALEKAKLIDEAAKVLLRMQKPARAAVIYSRHGMWTQAAQCFFLAEDRLQAAKCLREAGNFSEAGDLFAGEQKFSDAAECLEKAGQFAESARNWIKAKSPERAIDCWNSVALNPSLMAVFKPTGDEIQLMLNAIKSGASQPGLLAHMAKSPQVTTLILDLLSIDQMDKAIILFEKSSPHTASSLLSQVNVQSPIASRLVNLFRHANNHQYAGMILEQLNLFREASESYISAGDQERARYCLDRATGHAGERIQPHVPPLMNDLRKTEVQHQHPARASFIIEPASSSVKINIPLPRVSNQINSSGAVASSASAHSFSMNHTASTLTIDEQNIIQRSWLFNGTNTYEINNLLAFFHPRDLSIGDSVLVGSPDSFLVFATKGKLRLDRTISICGDWLSPEVGLSDRSPVQWVAESSSRIIEVQTSDLTRVFRQNSDLTRKVYTNLTQKLLLELDNYMNLKAV